MNPASQLAIAPGIFADARRALWLPEFRAVAVADLHIGYAWAHRTAGNLMPVACGEPTGESLLALVRDLGAACVVLVGDVVHGTVDSVEWLEGFTRWYGQLTAVADVVWVEGNHDRGSRIRLPGERVRSHRLGPCVFSHGHLSAEESGAYLVLGHHHPGVVLGDGIASRVRCPAFAVGPGWIVLPAFSPWVAGGTEPKVSPNRLAPETARIAIVGAKLLRIPEGVDPRGAAGTRRR